MFENQIINSLAIIILFLLGSYVVTFLLKLIEKATAKTNIDLDDRIIESVKLPIRYLAMMLGLFYAARNLDLSWTIKNRDFGVGDIMFVLIAFLAGFTISRVLKTVFIWYGKRDDVKISQTMFVFARKMISIIVYVIVLLTVFSQMEIQIAPILGALGIVGLAVAFGLKSTMENLFAALFLVMDKSINIGDWIQLEDGTKAYIEDISWRSVRIRTIGNNTVIVPNSVFVGQKISSYDYPVSSFFTSIRVGISYDTDLEKAEYVALQAAEKIIKDENIKEIDNNPIVRFKGFADSAIEFIVIVKIDKVRDEGRVQHALIKEIHKQFKENNIEIPFPQRVVHFPSAILKTGNVNVESGNEK
ncbi:mechanosensitive ion channel family protein [Candidatus Parcubacteria bacterium]|nr:mechanosensitive ion channel family protein [Candidatus Parcubacteria bacterium]